MVTGLGEGHRFFKFPYVQKLQIPRLVRANAIKRDELSLFTH